MRPPGELPEPLSKRAFTTREARDAGVTPARLRAQDLQRPYRGIRVPRPGTLGVLELCRALQRKLPDHAFFCGSTAAIIRGVPLPRTIAESRVLHVAVPHGRRALVGRGIAGRALSVGLGEVTSWGDLRVSSAERTWCDLGNELRLPALVAAGDFLIHWRLPQGSLDSFQAALADYPSRRGIRKLRLAIGMLDDRAESPRESEMRVMLVQAKLTEFESNVEIVTSGGSRYRGDLVFVAARVVVEYQGDHHRDKETYRADMTRKSRLEADGWKVVLVNADDLRDPVELLGRIRRYLTLP